MTKKTNLPALLTRSADDLVKVKMLIGGLKDAMPTTAKEMRRMACETLDDVITDLRGAA